jgi:hypothetical protein
LTASGRTPHRFFAALILARASLLGTLRTFAAFNASSTYAGRGLPRFDAAILAARSGDFSALAMWSIALSL